MKKLILLMVALLPVMIYAQETEWTNNEKEVLKTFSLDQNDHRGVTFTSIPGSYKSFKNLNSAIEYFFKEGSVMDLHYFHVESFGSTDDIDGKMLDIHELTKLYIQLNTKK